jgi:hypothetical protein
MALRDKSGLREMDSRGNELNRGISYSSRPFVSNTGKISFQLDEFDGLINSRTGEILSGPGAEEQTSGSHDTIEWLHNEKELNRKIRLDAAKSNLHDFKADDHKGMR